MADVNIKRVKSSEIEFKDRLVAINRVTKVTKGYKRLQNGNKMQHKYW